MKLTREQALKLHRQMWTDMQKELGDNPSHGERERFKESWRKEHLGFKIENNCVLCEFTHQLPIKWHEINCYECPIDWKSSRNWIACEGDGVCWYYSPISEILALPEREMEKYCRRH